MVLPYLILSLLPCSIHFLLSQVTSFHKKQEMLLCYSGTADHPHCETFLSDKSISWIVFSLIVPIWTLPGSSLGLCFPRSSLVHFFPPYLLNYLSHGTHCIYILVRFPWPERCFTLTSYHFKLTTFLQTSQSLFRTPDPTENLILKATKLLSKIRI